MSSKIEIVFSRNLSASDLSVIEDRVTKAARGEAVPAIEVSGQSSPIDVIVREVKEGGDPRHIR